MVVTPHYLASQAGIDVLQRGGNAIEAAIAAAATVAVVYPHANSIGGDNFWLIYNASDGAVSAINASGRSGSLASVDYYRSRGLDRIPARGYLAANTVPGAVSGWEAAFKYSLKNLRPQPGGIAWKELLRPAIDYAADGFPVSRHQADRSLIDFNAEDKSFGILHRFEECRRIFCNAAGKPWRCGDIILQTDLARILDLIAEKGAREFYQGEVARSIVSDMEAHDGTLTLDDFHSHEANWVEPISVKYRGYQAYNLPPNTQGMAALGCLNILNNFDLSRMHDGTADYYHLMAEVTKAAFAERDRWVTDPDFFDIPLERILSKDYGQTQANRIRESDRSTPSASTISGGDTVWIGVVDREGNAVSLIQSICDGFGSGVVPKGTGIVMQNRGKFFGLDDSSPNRLVPRKRTLHTLIAGMLLKEGKPSLVYGTMGGEGQPQTQTALVTRIVDFGYTPQEAIEAPRWLQGRFLDLTQPATQLHLEGRVQDSVVTELRRRGHSVSMTTDYSDMMGHAGAIFIDPSTLVLHGGADPRGDGSAVGF
jgi:gamma-glutamyltranspeptidase/glutathione hydrolase